MAKQQQATAPKKTGTLERAKERRALRAQKLRDKFAKRRLAGKPTSDGKRAAIRASRTVGEWEKHRESQAEVAALAETRPRGWSVTKGSR